MEKVIRNEDELAGEERNMASVRCPLCFSSPAEQKFTKESYPVHGCRICGCEFLDPQPSDSVLADIYGAQYFLGDHDESFDQRVAALKSATAALYLDQLEPVLATGKKHLLEVGCGTGDFLLEAQSRSLDVSGIEYSPVSVARANQRLGNEVVRQGTIEDASLLYDHFDVIAACDVIEHTRSPRAFLERARELLRPGGIVFLVTPSLDSWSRKLLGSRWMEYKVEHLFYFGQRSLARLLTDTGFLNPVFRRNRKVLSLDYVHRHFQRFQVAGLTQLFRLARQCTPESLAQRKWVVPASGVFVTAQKPQPPN